MNINRHTLFEDMRGKVFGRTYVQTQIDGINAVIDEWESRGLTDLRWLAYMLATDKWETALTMQPIEEWGKGAGHEYGKVDDVTGHAYYGRGLVQLTWKENYATMGKKLGVDLVNNPDKALDMMIAVQIMFEGMINGLFTGLSLARYFYENSADNWFDARRIINRLDHAQQISDAAQSIWSSLKEATKVTT